MSDSEEESLYDSSDDDDRFCGMDLRLQNTVYQMQIDRYKMFKDQDQENGHFDLALNIRGQKLYVHRFCLAAASSTFSAMVSFRWSNNAEVIEIENPDYSYDDIYQLVTFIYSGDCTITKKNVFALTDAAEYFGVLFLKDRCIKFLVKMDLVIAELEYLVTFAKRYSIYRVETVLHRFVRSNIKAIIDDEKFITHKQPFIEFLSELSKEFFEEEQFCVAAYKWAEHHADIAETEAENDPLSEEFDREEYIKTALQKVVSNIDMCLLNLKFVKEFLLKRKFLFSPSHLYSIIAFCQRETDEEDECFETLCDVARLEALKKSEETMGEKFKLKEVIRGEVARVLYGIYFCRMSVEFLMNFVVELGFDLPFKKLYDYLLIVRKMKKEDAFKAVYELAEKLVHQKTSETVDSLSYDYIIQQVSESSEFPSCSIATKVKNELAEVLKTIKFHDMDTQFLMDFVVEKEIPFSLKDVYSFLHGTKLQREELFKIIYNLAEKIVLQRQESFVDGDSTIYEKVKKELVEVLPKINFHFMRISFLIEFVVEREIPICFVLLNDNLLNVRNFSKEGSFRIIYQMAEKFVLQKQKSSPVDNFKLIDAVKKELASVLPKIEFHLMELPFLMEFVVEREIPFCFNLLHNTLLILLHETPLNGRNLNKERSFKIIYEMAEKLVLHKQKSVPVDNFNLIDAVKKELAPVLPNIEFHKMDLVFLTDFVVERGFLFSNWDLKSFVSTSRPLYRTQEELFEAIMKLTEKQVLQKQKAAADKSFNFFSAIKSELSSVRSCFEFPQMNLAYLMELVDRGLHFLCPTMLRKYVAEYRNNFITEESFFEDVYKLVENVALQKQKASRAETFNVRESIKTELSPVQSAFKFDQMKPEFLAEFVVGKGIPLSPTALRDIFLKWQNDYGNQEESLKAVYQLVEKQVLAEQIESNDENFDVSKAIKDVLVETLPVVRFCRMSKNFLTDFILKNGILTENEASRIFYTRVKVENNNKTISGVFEDKFGILKAVPPNGYYSTPRQWNKLRFGNFKYSVSTTPSTVQKMKGVEWYLCLEKDGTLALKHQTLLTRKDDYLIAEMKTEKSSEFELNTNKTACLTASYNNF